MSILIFFIVSYILLSLSLYKVFEKAGKESWKAFVPGLNFMEWCEIIGRPKWWAALLLVPIFNIFIYAGMCVDLVRSFGKYLFQHSALAVIYAPVIFYQIGKDEKTKYLGPTLDAEKAYQEKLQTAIESGNAYELKKLEANNPYKKSQIREWTEAIVFAVFAAAFIRMFLIEAYVIPTPSMEGSLLVGDFLFVSKAHYGIRMPQTIAMFPLLHNRMPIVEAESYLESPKLPYTRLPAIQNIKRNDPVVFNYPEGDSVFVVPGRTFSIHDLRRTPGLKRIIGKTPLTTRPMDKKDHYIKRCVGVAGDSIQVINRQLYINGKPAKNPKNIQYNYLVQTTNGPLNQKKLDELDINVAEQQPPLYILTMSDEQKAKVQAFGSGIIIKPHDMTASDLNSSFFPHDKQHYSGWTRDNYGPVYIPQKGETIQLTPQNIAFYKRVIGVYENNDLQIKNGQFIINGEPSNSYTFKMNYYWMMGDNRHNSEDSRVWGFVPEDHIVGKPLFIWFSTKDGSIANGINWSRIFTSANKD